MTTINNIEDLARILETQPHWVATLRTLLLSEELLALPETVANLTAAVQELQEGQARLVEGQARLTDAVQELREGQARLTDAVQELREGQARLTDAVQELQEGYARLTAAVQELQEGQARLTAAVQELREGQARLTAAVQELREGQARLTDAVQELREGQARLEARQDRLEANQARMETTLGYLVGSDLEARLHRRVRSLLSQQIGLRQSFLIQSTLVDANSDFYNDVTQAYESGLITPAQEQRISETDLILHAQRRADDAQVWVAAEAANRLDESDINRVRDTADALTIIYGEEAIPVVIGYRIDERDRERAEAAGVLVITIRPVFPP